MDNPDIPSARNDPESCDHPLTRIEPTKADDSEHFTTDTTEHVVPATCTACGMTLALAYQFCGLVDPETGEYVCD